MKPFLPILALLAFPALAQQDFSKVEILAEKLSDSVHMLTGAGGNMGLSVGDDAVFLVDDQFAPLTPKIEAAIAKLTARPVRFVLNTHWHFDHTGGNESFGSAGALIVAHENVRKRMSVESFIEFLGMKLKAEPRQALPVVTFTRDVTFHINGEEVYVLHLANAHTDGDAIVRFRKSDVVHMGDIFFNGRYPFIDTSSGGTVEGVIAAADRVLQSSTERTRIIPGHGPLARRADFKAYRDMLATVSGRIREHVRARRSLEEVQAAKPSAEFDALWGKGFLNPQRFTEMLYKNLER
jgi:glyoxylase-like metal-dependent hydrolase (beta-lactamase superfamily II)